MDNFTIIKSLLYNDLIIITHNDTIYRGFYKHNNKNKVSIDISDVSKSGIKINNHLKRSILEFDASTCIIEKYNPYNQFQLNEEVIINNHFTSNTAKDNLGKTCKIIKMNNNYFKSDLPKCSGIYYFEIEKIIKNNNYSII